MTMAMRTAIADAMVNGRSSEDIRGYLREAGVAEAELPTDHSLRTYQESAEYQTIYKQRQEACNLRFSAGMVAGCVEARVAILQNRTLEILECWLDNGATEPADIYKILNFTLQFQKQALVNRKMRHQMGERELPEALGPRDFPAAQMNAITATVMAKQEAQEAAAAEVAQAEALAAAVAAAAEDSGEWRRKTEENAGLSRSPELAEDDEPEPELALAVGAEYAHAQAASPSRPTFRNSPSPSTRAKARHNRKKRRR
jgi:hypothetical protein